MNSDNTAVGGVTIDYGPFGMLEKCSPAPPEPEIRKMNPESRTQKPETQNSKPEIRNPKPETRNPKPETRNRKQVPMFTSRTRVHSSMVPTPKTRNPKPET